MKKIKLIKLVEAWRYMSNNRNTSIFKIEHVSPYIYIYIYITKLGAVPQINLRFGSLVQTL